MNTQHVDNKPRMLDDVLVIDLTRIVSGPFCTMMMADLGARVIKVEQAPYGDDVRQAGIKYPDGESIYFTFFNRGKESIELDFNKTEDLELLKKMIAKADVLVENFRPGVMVKFGLDYETLAKINPRLIYCSITGFGQYGDLHMAPAYDSIVQAMSGIVEATGFTDGKATRVGTVYADLIAASNSMSSIMASLYAREKTGHGTAIDISMLDGAFAWMEQGLVYALGLDMPTHRNGNEHPFAYPFDSFMCKDRSIMICVVPNKQFEIMCDLMEIPECKTDPLFADVVIRGKNRKELMLIMNEILPTKTAKEWCDLFSTHGVPASIILNVHETKNLDHMKQRDMVVKCDDGRVIPGNPLKFSAYNSTFKNDKSPKLGQDTSKIREEFQ